MAESLDPSRTEAENVRADFESALRKCALLKMSQNWKKALGALPDEELSRKATVLGEAWRKPEDR